jgi:HK97 family phage major capsid protein
MTREDYQTAREEMLNEAQEFLDAGDLENATAKREAIEQLDADFEAASIEAANIAALKDEHAIAQEISNIVEGETTMENEVKVMPTYHDAFFKNIMGKTMTDDEKSVFMNYTSAAGSAGAAIPEETAQQIINKLKESAPLLNEVTLLNIAGNVKFAVEGTVTDAKLHAQNATLAAQEDVLVEVDLAGYEVTKLIQVSDTVSTMSIASFEGWLTDMLVAGIADKVTDFLINGTGSSQPEGLAAKTLVTTNYTVGGLTAKNVQSFIATLGGGYDSNAKILMNKATFFNEFAAVQDNGKNSIVKFDAASGAKYIYGYEVLLDSHVPANTAFLGDFSKIVANLAEAVNVKTQFDINSNSNKYLGVAIFDSKVALSEAFVKLAPSA